MTAPEPPIGDAAPITTEDPHPEVTGVAPAVDTAPAAVAADGPVGNAGPTAPARKPRWTRIDRPFAFGFLVTLGGLAAVLLGIALSNLSTILIYITFALFVALGLDPAVRALEKRGLSRAWSVLIVIAGLAVVLAVIVLTILPTVIDQITSFITSIPATIQTFLSSDFYASLEDRFGVGLSDVVSELEKFLSDPSRIAQLSGGALQIGGAALQVGAAIANGLSGALIVLVLTLYFLATMPAMKAGLLSLAPARDRGGIDRITTQITDSVGGYVMGMVTLAFINALLVFTLYLVLRLPFPPLMATVAFLITLIPLVGSLLFWVIGTGIALFTSPVLALIFALIYFVYMQVESYLITPRVMNRAIAIPGSLVVIGALVGGTLLGLLGALIAVPVTASILIIIKQVWVPLQNRKV